jgi:hypothetical protein
LNPYCSLVHNKLLITKKHAKSSGKSSTRSRSTELHFWSSADSIHSAEYISTYRTSSMLQYYTLHKSVCVMNRLIGRYFSVFVIRFYPQRRLSVQTKFPATKERLLRSHNFYAGPSRCKGLEKLVIYSSTATDQYTSPNTYGDQIPYGTLTIFYWLSSSASSYIKLHQGNGEVLL